jgi:hypothetical protein
LLDHDASFVLCLHGELEVAPNGLSASFWRVSRPTSEQQTPSQNLESYSREANRMSFSENVRDSEPIIHLRFRLDLALPLPSLSCLALNPGYRWIWCRGYYSAIPRDDRMEQWRPAIRVKVNTPIICTRIYSYSSLPITP